MKKFSKHLLAVLCASAIILTSGCSENTHSVGSPSDSSTASENADQNKIDLKTAVRAALKHAELEESQVTFVKTKLKAEDGLSKYEIEFYSASDKYEYEINAADASIIEFSAEKITMGGQPTVPGSVISEAEAKTIALKHAGLTENQVIFVKSRLDYSDGSAEYDIEFTANSTRYEYEVKASDGTVTEFSAEKIPAVKPQNPTEETGVANISEAEARAAALKHAGLTNAQAVFVKTKLDYDNGVMEYDIEFTADSTRYEYEIKASDGTVLKYSSEAMPAGQQPSQSTSANIFSVEKAKSAALKHAGVSEASAVFIKAKLDNDDGVYEYDIEFTTDSTRYEYEIRAADGAVLEFSAEPIYTAPQLSASSISKEEAKDIALKYVNASASQAVFIKAKQEYDDGISMYDIEFTADSVRYEFEIRASDGAILEFSAEPIPSLGSTGAAAVSEEEAKNIALKHTGFSASQVTFTEVKLDNDDGAAVYEVEFSVGSVKYEVKINAASGWVIEVDIDD